MGSEEKDKSVGIGEVEQVEERSRVATPLVVLSVTDGIATIRLDAPQTRNALSTDLLQQFHSSLDEAEKVGPRAIVLSHTMPVFSAGADLKERRRGPVDSGPLVRAMERLAMSPCPTIAAVRGPVRAGGVGLVASCDLAVVATDVTFAFTEVRLGLAPAIISVPILQRCLWSRLAAPFLTGASFGALEARDMGLVTHVSENVESTTKELTDAILLGAAGAVAATKRILRVRATFAEMVELSNQMFESAEAIEGMSAFLERRAPSWKTAKQKGPP